ncbi:uncharacterized protein PSFLO_07620 [Pseudozyma flocculosa]|uniref:Uncharacterized protein n=1 Tax=Pseudozyma flocculosa TaxID=84751 RepID=A0A5C3FEP1_9BASI|nr:uncharacterized protein PSFLO_07620 [Pseudozyma flocculosa]
MAIDLAKSRSNILGPGPDWLRTSRQSFGRGGSPVRAPPQRCRPHLGVSFSQRPHYWVSSWWKWGGSGTEGRCHTGKAERRRPIGTVTVGAILALSGSSSTPDQRRRPLGPPSHDRASLCDIRILVHSSVLDKPAMKLSPTLALFALLCAVVAAKAPPHPVIQPGSVLQERQAGDDQGSSITGDGSANGAGGGSSGGADDDSSNGGDGGSTS